MFLIRVKNGVMNHRSWWTKRSYALRYGQKESRRWKTENIERACKNARGDECEWLLRKLGRGLRAPQEMNSRTYCKEGVGEKSLVTPN